MSSTRISDLPDSINVSKSRSENGAMGAGIYMPLDIHANPYGTTPQPESIPFSQETHVNNQQNAVRAENTHTGFARSMVTNEEPPNWNAVGNSVEYQQPRNQQQQQHQPQHQPQQPQYRLPSRDMPNNTDEYTHDEQIHANYVPKKKLTSDYIRNFENDEENFIKKHENERAHRTNTAELAVRIQIPILLMFLFYVFHLSGFHSLGYKYFKGLGIYDGDGNMNSMGIMFKSILFGIVYFLMNEFVIWLNKP